MLGEVVLGAGIGEEFGSGHRRGEPLGDLEVLVALEDVHLQPHSFRPRCGPVVAPLAERQGRVAEHRAARSGTRLGERLRRQHSERKADIDDLTRQRLDGRAGTIDDRHRPADLLRVGHPVLDRVERPAVVEIGRMRRVAGVAQRGGETATGL